MAYANPVVMKKLENISMSITIAVPCAALASSIVKGAHLILTAYNVSQVFMLTEVNVWPVGQF